MQLHFNELEKYCDSLEHPGDIQVILHANYSKGFALTVSDGVSEHSVIDEENRPYCFRTVEMALDELANISYISTKIMIDRKAWS